MGDQIPWEAELDCVVSIKPEGDAASEIIQGNGDDPKYCPIEAGPDGPFAPGHIFRCTQPDGSLGPWQIGEFFVDEGNLNFDTPGFENVDCPLAFPSPPPCVVALSGDVNLDGAIDILDIVAMVNFILGATLFSGCVEKIGDKNSDDVINVLDVVENLNTILTTG